MLRAVTHRQPYILNTTDDHHRRSWIEGGSKGKKKVGLRRSSNAAMDKPTICVVRRRTSFVNFRA